MYKNQINRVIFTTISIFSVNTIAANGLEVEVIELDSFVATRINTQAQPKKFDIVHNIISPSYISGSIPHNSNVGSLRVILSAKKRSKIRVEHDHPNDLFSRSRDLKEVIFRREGSRVNLSFNAFKPIAGTLRIYNENNKLIHSIPYRVIKEKAFRQSLTSRVNDRKSGTLSSENHNQNLSVSYRVSKKAKHITDPRWSVSTSINTDLDDTNNRSISTSFSINW